MLTFLIHYLTAIIDKLGYTGVTILMTLESMVAPVPSEAVMPFAGFLISEGKMSFWLIVLFATIGSLIGSLLSYYIGLYGGRLFLDRYGKYLLLNKHHLDLTERFFLKYGEVAIFLARFIPIVRHLSSLPAGLARMNIVKFVIFTVLGAGLWNSFLTYLGMMLGSRWESIRQYSEILDVAMVVFIAAVIGYFFYYQLKKRKSRQ